ncbi:MAG: hypothetical protein HKN68_04230 [Saprospiraceae bacterium]|nr:hypothetical protein [Saprospiraceae bacterium]
MSRILIYSLMILTTFILIQCGKDDPIIEIPEEEMEMEKDTTTGEENIERFYRTDNYIVDDIAVEVYIPSDYDSTQQYPVIYLNDGDLMAEVYAQMINFEADPFIMVGLSDDRKRAERFLPYFDQWVEDNVGEYTPKADEYSRSIVEEVIPFVESEYSILARKRAIFGISFGGIHATWIAIRYPQVFSFVGAISPSYWVAGKSIYNEPLFKLNPGGFNIPTTFYIDRGTAEWENYLTFIELLKEEGLVYGQTIYYYEVIGADHEMTDWTFRIEVPFRLFMEGTTTATEVKMDVSSYCVEIWDEPGVKYGRINPLLTFNNGVKYSATSEATYTITQGTGQVINDGSYFINQGTSLTVDVKYQDFETTIELNKCN